MIFYGTKGSHIHSERTSKGVECDNCEEVVPHNISVYGKYVYLYWIPVFPIGKRAFSECTNCKVTNDFSGMNEKLKQHSLDIKKHTKTPVWYWSGLGIFALLIFFVFYYAQQHEKDKVIYIASPEKGDIIEYKPSDFYSTLKIVEVTKDSVYVVQNNYEIERRSKLYKIDKVENYGNVHSSFSKKEYKAMFENRAFLDVDR
ncbi:hypothetical protein SAMN04489761_3107 [Tenacibaculum sp. MAR_2009_124]|uniref:hypothetical protein n=1 Tax=Tenacibaculum sp. MAR_2009_124 TaxID=1250059 RepID=UPI00089D07E7|nr:hypothetical protein [Tenacibaculum sp. MAR_2009_124]SEC47907.1 hypothetical protein SAMN04489761_3107 [Tenacibaculum sp. MAR_2009_124]